MSTITDAIEAQTKPEADIILEDLVDNMLAHPNNSEMSRRQAYETVRRNLGYIAGYYDHETRIRVEELFECCHPYFPPAKDGPVSFATALKLGMLAAQITPIFNAVEKNPPRGI